MGRKSKYDPAFCDELIKHMEMGLSFEACCGEFGVSKDTGYEWVKRHPEFAEAKGIGETKGQAFWEKMARDNLIMPGGKDAEKFNTTAYIFNMKNRFGWRERKELSGNIGVNVGFGKAFANFSDDQMRNKISELLERFEDFLKGPVNE